MYGGPCGDIHFGHFKKTLIEYGQQMYGKRKRAVIKAKLTLRQNHNRGTNPKTDGHTLYRIELSHSTQLYNKSNRASVSRLHRTVSDIQLGLGLRFGTPSLLCVRVSSLQESVRYHADAVQCSPMQ